jgi:DNA-binding IclR family transcriptional regulator
MSPQAKARPGIQSVEIAGKILQALAAAGRPLALKDLAKAARMHPGKAHRYLVSLTRIELVSQDEASGHYGIGPMAISLGLAGLRNVDVVRTSTALLPTLRDEINETVLLAIWSPQGPVVFALEESSRPVYMNIRVGSILPLTTTATGRVFAAFLPGEITAALMAAEQAKAPRMQTMAQISRAIGDARKQGLAQVQGDLVPGVNAIASTRSRLRCLIRRIASLEWSARWAGPRNLTSPMMESSPSASFARQPKSPAASAKRLRRTAVRSEGSALGVLKRRLLERTRRPVETVVLAQGFALI